MTDCYFPEELAELEAEVGAELAEDCEGRLVSALRERVRAHVLPALYGSLGKKDIANSSFRGCSFSVSPGGGPGSVVVELTEVAKYLDGRDRPVLCFFLVITADPGPRYQFCSWAFKSPKGLPEIPPGRVSLALRCFRAALRAARRPRAAV